MAFCSNVHVLTAERRDVILERLREDGRVVATELSERLDVSVDTVRRDLRELAELGLVQRCTAERCRRSRERGRTWSGASRRSPPSRRSHGGPRRCPRRPGDPPRCGNDDARGRAPPASELRATVITNSPAIAPLWRTTHTSRWRCSAACPPRRLARSSAQKRSGPFRSIRADVLVLVSGACTPRSGSPCSSSRSRTSSARWSRAPPT